MNNFKTNVAKLTVMMQMQDDINSVIYPDWRERRFPWHRAIWTECAEMMDHVGWKWWHNIEHKVDTAQVNLELVDVWHFGISILIQNIQPSQYEELAIKLGNTVFEPTAGAYTDIRVALEAFVSKTLADKLFHVHSFSRLMALSGLSFDELYTMYVGKNVLNKFRQDNGYKTGGYVKIWNGLEDNKVLAASVSKMNADAADFPTLLYSMLHKEYHAITVACRNL